MEFLGVLLSVIVATCLAPAIAASTGAYIGQVMAKRTEEEYKRQREEKKRLERLGRLQDQLNNDKNL